MAILRCKNHTIITKNPFKTSLKKRPQVRSSLIHVLCFMSFKCLSFPFLVLLMIHAPGNVQLKSGTNMWCSDALVNFQSLFIKRFLVWPVTLGRSWFIPYLFSFHPLPPSLWVCDMDSWLEVDSDASRSLAKQIRITWVLWVTWIYNLGKEIM